MKEVERRLDEIIRETKKEFNKKMKKLSDEELAKLDKDFTSGEFDLMDFYGGYHPKGKYADLKKQAYLDFLYMYYITHPDREWDERYDQPIFGAAIRYAEKEVAKKKKRVKI
jgi:hypothetical protein